MKTGGLAPETPSLSSKTPGWELLAGILFSAAWVDVVGFPAVFSLVEAAVESAFHAHLLGVYCVLGIQRGTQVQPHRPQGPLATKQKTKNKQIAGCFSTNLFSNLDNKKYYLMPQRSEWNRDWFTANTCENRFPQAAVGWDRSCTSHCPRVPTPTLGRRCQRGLGWGGSWPGAGDGEGRRLESHRPKLSGV